LCDILIAYGSRALNWRILEGKVLNCAGQYVQEPFKMVFALFVMASIDVMNVLVNFFQVGFYSTF